MPNVLARRTIFLLSALLLACPGPRAWADDEVNVMVKAHVKLERLHPDVDSVLFACEYLDKQGHNLVLSLGAHPCDAYNETKVGGDRKVNGNMSFCVAFDEKKALKAAWDRYKCTVYFGTEDSGPKREVPRPDHPKAWARVKPGAALVSEGKFNMD